MKSSDSDMIDPPYVNPQHRVPPKRWAYRCAVLLAGLLTLALVAALVWVVFVYVMLLCADTYTVPQPCRTCRVRVPVYSTHQRHRAACPGEGPTSSST